MSKTLGHDSNKPYYSTIASSEGECSSDEEKTNGKEAIPIQDLEAREKQLRHQLLKKLKQQERRAHHTHKRSSRSRSPHDKRKEKEHHHHKRHHHKSEDEGETIDKQVNDVRLSEEVGDDQEDKDVHMEEPEPQTSTTIEKVPKKYSRFDSSPEPSPPPSVGSASPSRSEEYADEYEHTEDAMEDDLILLEEKLFEDLTDEDRERLTEEQIQAKEKNYQKRLISQLPIFYPGIRGCRSVSEYKILNKISEGTYGVVYRAKELRTDDIVALKGLKMEKEKEGFPITSLREINMLMKCRMHKNIVGLREIVVGDTMDSIFLVMEFVEHDVKALMEQLHAKNKRFTLPQIKTLMKQLLDGIAYMHSEWVIHRDLKTSNLLLSHGNILKIGDFGLAREYGDPLKNYTSLVVTLWYRAPELLLGTKIYSTPIDVWSVGCIFGEFLTLKPMFPGHSEMDQIKKIFADTGAPNENIWPGYKELPHSQHDWPDYKFNQINSKYLKDLRSMTGVDLMNRLLTLCPERRITAEEALNHNFFTEDPQPAALDSFPSWPAKSEGHKAPPKRTLPEPPAAPAKPIDPNQRKLLNEFKVDAKQVKGFSLKF